MAVIQPLPPPPQTTDGQTGFDNRADPWVLALNAFALQCNQVEVNLMAAAMPGGIALPYIFDGSSTADADPGSGKFRIGASPQGAAAALRLDVLTGVGSDASALLDSLPTISTGTVKGQLRIQKVGDPSKWLLFDVTGVATPGGGGYRNLAVTIRAYSAPSPFTDTDAVVITFTPKGDKGDPGVAPWVNALSSQVISTPVASITLGPFPAGYAEWAIPFGVGLSGTSAISLSLSQNGTTFTPTASLASGSSAYAGTLKLFDVSGDRGGFAFDWLTASSVVGASPALSVVNQRTAGEWAVTGGIAYARLSVATTFTSGLISQPRAR